MKKMRMKVLALCFSMTLTVSALAGAKFRIRYMGNQLLADPKTDG